MHQITPPSPLVPGCLLLDTVCVLVWLSQQFPIVSSKPPSLPFPPASAVPYMKGINQYFTIELARISSAGPELTDLWDGAYPFAWSFIWLPVDAFLYILLAIYLDNVLPGLVTVWALTS